MLKKSLSLSLEAARTALINFMQIWENNNSYKGRINIIFDGTDEFDNNSQVSSGNCQPSSTNNRSTHNNKSTNYYNQTTRSINCIYSKSGQKADDYIISMVRDTKNRSCITVVSNDNYVRGTCSSLGAATEQPAFLTAHSKTKARKITGQKNTRGISKVSIKAEKEINEFLKEKWKIE